MITAVIAILGIIASGCVDPEAVGPGSATTEGQTASTYEETRHLSGHALADALGLEPLDIPRGAWIDGSDPRLGACAKGASASPAGTVSTGKAVYCLAGVAENEFQEWDLAQRLAGFAPPCDLLVEAFHLSEGSERAALDGDDARAEELLVEAHDLKIEASETEGCGERVTEPASE
jgi:hypothetical protein